MLSVGFTIDVKEHSQQNYSSGGFLVTYIPFNASLEVLSVNSSVLLSDLDSASRFSLNPLCMLMFIDEIGNVKFVTNTIRYRTH